MTKVFKPLVIVLALTTALVACPTVPPSDAPSPASGVPKAPEQFVAFGSSTTTITLAWNPTKDVTGYVLERKVGTAGKFEPFARISSQVTSLLDQNLSRTITYSYRLQAFNDFGMSRIIEQTAMTNADEVLTTQNEPLIEQPIQQIVNRQGGSVSSLDGQTTAYFPMESVPDGTQITIQTFVNPVEHNPRPGLEISSSVPFIQPISVSFWYSEQDVLDSKNFVMALQESDGSWVVRPSTVDEATRTVTLTISPDPPSQAGVSTQDTRRGKSKAKVLMLRSTWIVPNRAQVRVKKQLVLTAYGLFSDYPCDVPGLDNQVLCTAIGLVVDPNQMVRPILREIKKLENNLSGWDRDWTVELKIGGGSEVGTIVKNGQFGAVYTAPDNKPSQNPVAVRFTSVRVSRGNRYSAIPIPAEITVVRPNYKVVGDFTSVGYPACAAFAGIADLTDHVEFTLLDTGNSKNPYTIEISQNSASENKNFRASTYAAGATVTQNSLSEVLNATKGSTEFKASLETLSVELEGGSWIGGCTVSSFNYPAGDTVPSSASFEFNLNAFVNNTQKVTGTDQSGFGTWEFTITRQ